jgi:hypothetical protein
MAVQAGKMRELFAPLSSLTPVGTVFLSSNEIDSILEFIPHLHTLFG